ncbi:Lrp/AsnC family transcriptional regulator [Gammaproteobacteria bacterium AS21]|jgi:DNA-binding Lrp family transcriptional regulator
MHKVILDRQDVRILEILQQDSRVSKLELADSVNLSPSQCYRRLKRLEDSGLIEKYVTMLNLEKAGLDVWAIVMVSFSKTVEGARDKVLEKIQALDEVQECYSASGEYDFILRVNSQNMRSFSALINKQLYSQYILAMHSYILLERLKYHPVLPITASV